MAGNFKPELPEDCWESITQTDFSPADMEATMEAIGEKAPPFILMLGSSGVNLATQLRLYDFGEMRDAFGKCFEEKKQNPVWLAAEALCLKGELNIHRR